MPGRFPLTPVALANDPFCTDAFCGEGGGGGPASHHFANR